MPRTIPREMAKVAAVGAYLVAIETFARRHDLTFAFVGREYGPAAAVGWALLLLATLAAVLCLLLVERPRVALANFNVAASFFIVNLSFRAITGAGLTVTTARLIFEEGGYGVEALAFHGGRATSWALAGLALVLVVRVVLTRFVRVRTTHDQSVLALGWLAACSVGTVLLPIPSVVPSFFGVPTALAEALVHPPREGARRSVSMSHGAALTTHVVLIVDESVRGDLLSLARPETGTTPWLEVHRAELADFGVAASATNCSATSNAALLVGLREDELPDRTGAMRTRPTIFDHAVLAGFRTVLVDAQATHEGPPWALTQRDMATIGRSHVLRRDRPDLPPSEVDQALLEVVVEATGTSGPTFVYANKRGAHYRYASALPSGPSPGTDQRAAALGFAGVPEAAEYLDALTHAVDRFFAELVPRLEGRDVLVLYTSDHGESLLEDGVSRTHCMEGRAAPEQGRVPLFVWHGRRGSSPLFARLVESARTARDRSRAFEVFPTILVAFGFDERAVAAGYGVSLLDGAAPRTARSFFSGDVLAKASWWWNRIDP